jgi:hypothetical protein
MLRSPSHRTSGVKQPRSGQIGGVVAVRLTKASLASMLMRMANMCDGCGEQATVTRYWPDGLLAGRTLCRGCISGRKKMTRLSSLVAFKFKLAQVLPPDDKATAPLLRLMMAVDDVRRAQIKLIEAIERLDGTGSDKYVALGDWLYYLRLLISHLHEARLALMSLEIDARGRADALLADRQEVLDRETPERASALRAHRHEARQSLQALRKFFGSAEYRNSFIARVRNVIGFHYDGTEIAKLIKAHVSNDDLLESTAASVGGLARMADPFVRGILNILNGGDFMADMNHTHQVKEALHTISGHLISVVDNLFDALMRANMDAVVEKHEAIVEVPPLVIRAGEAARRLEEEG